MKAETVSMVFLIIVGSVFIVLGFTTWLGAGFYGSGLIYIFWGLSYVWKAYVKYVVPTMLLSGVTIAVLGWYFLPRGSSLKLFTAITGISMCGGGLVNLVVVLARVRK